MVLVNINVNQDGQSEQGYVKNPFTTQTTPAGVGYTSTQIYMYKDIFVGPYPNTTTPTGTSVSKNEARPYFTFTGITIPQNAVIGNATLRVYAQSEGGAGIPNNTTPAIARVYARKIASPLPYTTNSPAGTPIFTEGDKGTAFGQFTVTYSETTLSERNIDIKAVVQELVNAFDYNNDNMLFFMKSVTVFPAPTTTYYTTSTKINIQAREGAQPFEVPMLIVNYHIGQLCKPVTDVSNAGAWEDTTFGNSDTELWDELDEVFPDEDASAVRGKQNADVADTFEVKLENCADPESDTGHTIRIRARGVRDQVKVQLYQGVTLIAESGNFALTGEFVTYEYTLSGGEADAITNYNDLRIRVVPSVVP